MKGAGTPRCACPRTQTGEAWALSLLEEDDVYVHPGGFFDFRDEAFQSWSLSLRTKEARLRGRGRASPRAGGGELPDLRCTAPAAVRRGAVVRVDPAGTHRE